MHDNRIEIVKANAEVNGIGKIVHVHSSETVWPVWMQYEIYHYVDVDSRVQCLMQMDLAIAILHMCEKVGGLVFSC